MKSPFPGMDPYLEAHWGDVHRSLVTYARDQLRRQLPPDLKVRVEERVAVEAVPREAEPATERHLQIVDTTSGNRVVTAIEFLSPVNKSHEAGRRAYRAKQRDMTDGGVNLVEIDLLREGQYILAAAEASLPAPYRIPYRICVVRASAPNDAEVYRVPLEEPLPRIRIPLRAEDEDALLDLQCLIEQAYESGGYDDLDYRQEAVPRLSSPHAEWADALLRQAGRR